MVNNEKKGIKESRKSADEELVFDKVPKTDIVPIYRMDERPKTWGETILYGFQTTIVDFTPFIWATVFITGAGADTALIPKLISACFFAMFIATMIQTVLGNRLPIVQGPSAALATTMGGVAKVFGLPAVWAGQIIGGLLEWAIGTSRVLGFMRKVLPMIVIGCIVTTIGLTVTKVSATWILGGGSTTNLLLALLTLLVALFFKFSCKNVWGGILERGFIIFSVVLVGVGIGSLTGSMDWQAVAAAKWFGFPSLFPLYGGSGFKWHFAWPALVGVFAGYLASIFESIGGYAATCAVIDEKYTVRQMNRGIAAEGAGCVAASLLGALPLTSYAQNIGVIAATRVASRFVIQVAAFFFLLYSLSPKLAAFLAAIPRGAVGGCLALVAALITTQGLNIATVETLDTKNGIIVGSTLGLAFGVPSFVQLSMGDWVASVHPFLQLLLTDSIVISVFWGFLISGLLALFARERGVSIKDSGSLSS